MRLRFLVVLSSLSFGPACIAPTNPFDPETPPESQEPGTLSGTIFAVRAPTNDDDGRPITASGPCALSTFEGENSGFSIALQRLPDGDAIETPPTNASGAFVIRNLIPGTYALSVHGDGFAAPPLEQIDVDVGGAVTRTLCALDDVAPAVPLPGALPATIGPDDVVTLRVLNPEPGATYTITERALGQTPSTQDVQAPDETPLAVRLSLAGVVDDRVPWTIDVVATDVLHNASAPAVVNVVRDARAPAAPVDVHASSTRDRVFVSFAPAPPDPAHADDEPPVAFYVGYAVTPRPRDPLDGCPVGRPFDDVPDDAFFAAEGGSPLLTTANELTLSGLVPGTEVYLYVAAVDAVGNVGCYSDEVRARVDEVTFAPLADVGVGVVGPKAIVALPGSTLGALPGGFHDGHRVRGLYAVAGNGTVVVDSDGGAHPLRDVGAGGAVGPDIAADDLAVAGDVLVLAGGPRGVGTVPLDPRGAPTDVVAFDGIGNVAAVAGEPGVVFAAAANGLFENGVRIATGAFVDVALVGSLVVAVKRDGANYAVVVHDRRAGFAVVDSAPFLDPPRAAAVVGRSYVVVDDVGVSAFDLARCLPDGGARACIVAHPRRALPGGERGSAVGALDEIALVGTTAGSVFAVALPSLRVVGRTTFPNAVGGVVADELGFCAAVAGEPALACASAVAFPVQDGEARVSTPSAALNIVVLDGHVVASAGARVTFAPLDDLGDAVDVDVGAVGCDAAPAGTTGCDVADLGAAFGAALVLRDDGTLLAVRAGSAPDVVIELGAQPGVVAALGDGPYQGRVVATGATALVALAAVPLTGGVPARLLRLSLRVAPSGDVGADVEDDVTLPDLRVPTSLGIHGAAAWLATSPVGLLTFDRSAALTLVAGSAAPDVGTDPRGQTFASGLVLVGASTTPLVAARVGGVGDRLGYFDDAAFVARPAITPLAINDVRRAGRFVVATTLDGSAWLLDPADAGGTIAAVLSLPSTTNAQEGAATARSLVFADGAGGVLRVLLR